MSDRRQGVPERREQAGVEALVQRLIEDAGPRPDVPEEHLASIKAAFREEWEERIASHRSASSYMRRRAVLLAAAAVVMVAIALGWWWQKSLSPQPLVARVEKVEGVVLLREQGGGTAGSERLLDAGATLLAGAELEGLGAPAQRAGRVSLLLATGISMRIDQGSRVRLVSADRVELEQGAVYVDSGPGLGRRLEVETPLGTARNVGTQFEIRLLEEDGPALRVRVREGRVVLDRGAEVFEAVAGEERTLRADGTGTVRPIGTYGEIWEWAVQMAPAWKSQDPNLADFLAWLERESGWEVRYEADREGVPALSEIEVFGDLSGRTPKEAMEAVLLASGMTWTLEEGTLTVHRP